MGFRACVLRVNIDQKSIKNGVNVEMRLGIDLFNVWWIFVPFWEPDRPTNQSKHLSKKQPRQHMAQTAQKTPKGPPATRGTTDFCRCGGSPLQAAVNPSSPPRTSARSTASSIFRHFRPCPLCLSVIASHRSISLYFLILSLTALPTAMTISN